MRSTLLAASFAAASCSSTAPARPQLLIVVDTDVPVVGQIASRPELSLDAAIDTVRIDVIRADGSTYDFRDIVAPDARDWPFTFGVTSSEATNIGIVQLRIRGFRASLAKPGQLNGTATLEPAREVAIDRVVVIPLPESGIDVVRVVLRGDCLGLPASFLYSQSTCIDGARIAGDPSDGVARRSPIPATEAGTWAGAREAPCASDAPDGQVCIPGGYTLMGDPDLAGYFTAIEDPTPLRPVIVSPFFLDKAEMTVRRFRDLVNQKAIKGLLPGPYQASDPVNRFCTWLGPNDALPLTCVTWATAGEACRALGGALPSEAQWEHAARGRGQRRAFPWGGEDPTCCIASVSRDTGFGLNACTGVGLEPVGSHQGSSSCAAADVSRDGVLDMGGGVRELTLDAMRGYADPCRGGAGVQTDPTCAIDGAKIYAARGGDWSSGPALAHSAFRFVWSGATVATGFRCAYPAVPQ